SHGHIKYESIRALSCVCAISGTCNQSLDGIKHDNSRLSQIEGSSSDRRVYAEDRRPSWCHLHGDSTRILRRHFSHHRTNRPNRRNIFWDRNDCKFHPQEGKDESIVHSSREVRLRIRHSLSTAFDCSDSARSWSIINGFHNWIIG